MKTLSTRIKFSIVLLSILSLSTSAQNNTISNGIAADSLTVAVELLSSNQCFGDSTAVIIAHARGGVGTYFYSLEGAAFQRDSIFRNLPSGTYSIYVVDDSSSVTNDTLVIDDSEEIVLSSSTIEPTSQDCDNGVINVYISGGAPPYSYLTSHGVSDSLVTDSFALTGLTPATYSVWLTDSNGCEANISDIINACPFGITEQHNIDVSIYPNPSTGLVTVDLKGFEAKRIQVLNLLGELMYQSSNLYSTTLKLDLSDYPKGSYFVKVDGESQSIVKTLILQ